MECVGDWCEVAAGWWNSPPRRLLSAHSDSLARWRPRYLGNASDIYLIAG
jgi:hypothetical protein